MKHYLFHKHPLHIWAFAFLNAGVFFAGGSLSLKYYFIPMIIGISFICLSVFRGTFKLKLEHLCISALCLIALLHIQTTIAEINESGTIGSVLLFFAFFFLLTLPAVRIQDLKCIANSFILSGAIISVYMIIFPYEYTTNRYSYLMFGQPVEVNYIASYLSICLLFAIKRPFLSNTKHKYCFLGFAVLILYAMLLTGSRGAFIASVISCLLLLTKLHKNWLIIVSIFVGVGIALFWVLPEYLRNRFVFSSYNDGSNHLRLWQFQTALSFSSLHPLLGYGVISPKWIIGTAAHNTFLTYLLQFGGIGLCFLGILLLKIIKHCFNLDLWFILVLFINILITSMIIDNTNTIPFWFTITFLMMTVNYKQKHPETHIWEEI